MIADPLSALDHAPRISAVDGEVVVIGEHVCAAYTARAARQKAKRLLAAAEEAERQHARPSR